MVIICTTCLHPERGDASHCIQCGTNFAQIQRCPHCTATRFAFANFCYGCGASLKVIEATHLRPISADNFDPTRGAKSADVDGFATTFHSNGVLLFHSPSTVFIDLPAMLDLVVLGKGRGTFRPDIDFQNFPHAEFVSRSHAQISLKQQQYYIEDLGSKNGTEINGVTLPKGRAQILAFGDRIRLGGSDAFRFIFVKDQPINAEHLKMISGEDSAFEAELLTSYVGSVSGLLDALKQAIETQDFKNVKYLGNQITIASYNVGADVMNLLGKQLEDQALQQSAPACEKTWSVLNETLDQIRLFLKVFYGA
jgi:HPt (histidine-containing phosphotransfer) domain-containing protein/rubredoxin